MNPSAARGKMGSLEQQQQKQLKEDTTNGIFDTEEESQLQRRYLEQQQQQEQYYHAQMEEQQRQIIDQQQMLDRMSQAMQQQQQQFQQGNQQPRSGRSEVPASVKRLQNQKQNTNGPQQLSGSKERGTFPINGVSLEQGLERRLEIIETSLNRVCNQHDALMPLLQLLDTVPQLQRSEQQVKNLSKKYIDVEKRLKDIEGQEKKDTQYQHIFSNIDRNFKNTHTQIAQLRKDFLGLENDLNNVQQIPEAKMKEDSLNLYRQVDQKLDRNMKDVKILLADFKNQIQLETKRGGRGGINGYAGNTEQEEDAYDNNEETYENNNSRKRTQFSPAKVYQQVNEQLQQQERAFQIQLANHQRFISQSYNQTNGNSSQSKQQEMDVANIYREIGMLRAEMELLFTQQRQDIINQQLQRTKSPSAVHTQLLIAGLEQNMYLQEIECFDELNQQRIIQELDGLNEKLAGINRQVQTIENNEQRYNNQEDYQSDLDKEETASKKMLLDQFQDQDEEEKNASKKNKNALDSSAKQMIGYELRFIGDRLFNFKQQIHGTKKKYLCDTRRLEDRLQTVEELTIQADQNKKQIENEQSQQISKICRLDSLKNRVEMINQSVGNHVAALIDKLSVLDAAFNYTKEQYSQLLGKGDTTKGRMSS